MANDRMYVSRINPGTSGRFERRKLVTPTTKTPDNPDGKVESVKVGLWRETVNGDRLFYPCHVLHGANQLAEWKQEFPEAWEAFEIEGDDVIGVGDREDLFESIVNEDQLQGLSRDDLVAYIEYKKGPHPRSNASFASLTAQAAALL